MAITTYTKAQVVAALEAIMAIGDAIRDLGSVPSGELYARLMSSGMGLETYQQIIRQLVNARLVTETGHLLVWTGPPKPSAR